MSPNHLPALLTHRDLAAFWAAEERVALGEHMSAAQQRLLDYAMKPLRDQAAWLSVEEVFSKHPGITHLSARLIGDSNSLVRVKAVWNDKAGGGYKGVAEDLEQLEMTLGNMIISRELVEAMKDPMTREVWLDAATEWLGEAWRATRDCHLTQQALDDILPGARGAGKKGARL